jgi:hypothetical protein
MTPTSVRRLIESLEVAGCQPWQPYHGVWLALCPTCKAKGWNSYVEIHETGVVACVGAHEPPPGHGGAE